MKALCALLVVGIVAGCSERRDETADRAAQTLALAVRRAGMWYKFSEFELESLRHSEVEPELLSRLLAVLSARRLALDALHMQLMMEGRPEDRASWYPNPDGELWMVPGDAGEWPEEVERVLMSLAQAQAEEAEIRRLDPELYEKFPPLKAGIPEADLQALYAASNDWQSIAGNDVQAASAKSRALSARAELYQALIAELETAMDAGGPPAAIEICSERAAGIARDIGTQNNLRIGRTSDRRRNWKNGPPYFAYDALREQRTQELAFRDRNGRHGFVFPIFLTETCVACHGQEPDIAPETRAAIAARYPHDRATGYKPGDLRGYVWVVVPAAPR